MDVRRYTNAFKIIYCQKQIAYYDVYEISIWLCDRMILSISDDLITEIAVMTITHFALSCVDLAMPTLC